MCFCVFFSSYVCFYQTHLDEKIVEQICKRSEEEKKYILVNIKDWVRAFRVH